MDDSREEMLANVQSDEAVGAMTAAVIAIVAKKQR